MPLALDLAKPGQTADTTPKLQLSTAKSARFRILMSWDTKHDLDVHALLATDRGDGQGPKITKYEELLSYANVVDPVRPHAILKPNADGSFSTPCGSLTHSPDKRNGLGNQVDDVDEWIEVDGSKVPAGVNQIPIFVTLFPDSAGTFADVKSAKIKIVDADTGRLINGGEYELTNAFARFNAIQMGALMLGPTGWQFAPIGVGFNADLGQIVAQFS